MQYLPQMQDEDKRPLRIRDHTHKVFIAIKRHKTAAPAKAFLSAVLMATPFKAHTILTDCGKKFTNRLFASHSANPQ